MTISFSKVNLLKPMLGNVYKTVDILDDGECIVGIWLESRQNVDGIYDFWYLTTQSAGANFVFDVEDVKQILGKMITLNKDL